MLWFVQTSRSWKRIAWQITTCWKTLSHHTDLRGRQDRRGSPLAPPRSSPAPPDPGSCQARHSRTLQNPTTLCTRTIPRSSVCKIVGVTLSFARALFTRWSCAKRKRSCSADPPPSKSAGSCLAPPPSSPAKRAAVNSRTLPWETFKTPLPGPRGGVDRLRDRADPECLIKPADHTKARCIPLRAARVRLILYEMCFNLKHFWQWSLLHVSFNFASKDRAV